VEAIDQFVTRDEVSEILAVTADRVDAMVEEGLLQPTEIDGETWFHRAEVEALRLQGG
jgi:hypothetical protein